MPKKRKIDSDEDATNDDNNEEIVNHITPKSKKRKDIRYEDEEEDSQIMDNSQAPDFKVLEEAEVGIIEKVSVSNFMCHRKLEVSLGANVNFIIGRNGSGKSAILTGLIVGLGGKANVTNRGNSLKGFIKEGCTACTITITLRNRGTDAYKPDEYGESIIVERRLSSDGYTGYKIKSADNRTISTKKDELIAILDQYNIQIDNPVSILTQDTSRSFLNASNEKSKYMFFLKATQLEQMSTDYQKIIEEKELIKETLSKKKKSIPQLHEAVKVYQEKYDDMKQLQVMKSKIGGLKRELTWAMVGEKNQEVNDAKKIEQKYAGKVPHYQKHLDETCAGETKILTAFSAKTEELNAFTDEVNVLANERQELLSAHRKKKLALKQVQDQSKRTERDMSHVEKDKKCLLERIEEIKLSSQRDFESERQAREQQIRKNNEELQKYQAQLNSSNHYLQQQDMAVKRNQEKKYKLQNEERDVRRQIEHKRKKLLDLETTKKDKLSLFGAATVSILKAIETAHNQGKFHRKPVGPLGSLFQLKDSKWAIAVEQCIKGTMLSYACHDSHDMLLLKGILKNCCRKQQPGIIISQFADHVYDTSQNRPVGHTSVLDMLETENHIVANSLIDQCSIESVILMEDAKQAQRLMWFNQPRGSWKAYSIEGHEIIGGRSSKYYPCKKRNAQYLQKDVASMMQQAEAELLQSQHDLKQVLDQLKALNSEIVREKGEVDRTRKKAMNEQYHINNITQEIQELEAHEEEKLPDISALETEVKECEEKLMQLNQQLSESKISATERSEEVEKHINTLSECDERCQVASEKLETLRSEQQAVENELSKLKGHKKHYKDKLSELMKNVEEAGKKHEKLRQEYENMRASVLQKFEEVEVTRNVKSLESEIFKAQKRIDREESRRGSHEEITEKYQGALKKYDDAKKAINNCKSLQRGIDRAMKRRAKRFSDFQKYIVLRAKHYFHMLLSQRGYSGKLCFDHDTETLSIQVNVENAVGANTKDSKSLSGGERSFSTICFIMALWEAMEAPFRCLDEFDVFMDMLNRRISMNMLMKIAKQQLSRQFILLTPQDMSQVSGSKRVRIFKLQDPERGQQTIDFQPSS